MLWWTPQWTNIEKIIEHGFIFLSTRSTNHLSMMVGTPHHHHQYFLLPIMTTSSSKQWHWGIDRLYIENILVDKLETDQENDIHNTLDCLIDLQVIIIMIESFD
jgi:hypothetical protein